MGSRRCPDVLTAGEEGLAQQELKRIIPRTRESADHLAEMSTRDSELHKTSEAYAKAPHSRTMTAQKKLA
jgi:hypothetical protein